MTGPGDDLLYFSIYISHRPLTVHDENTSCLQVNLCMLFIAALQALASRGTQRSSIQKATSLEDSPANLLTID